MTADGTPSAGHRRTRAFEVAVVVAGVFFGAAFDVLESVRQLVRDVDSLSWYTYGFQPQESWWWRNLRISLIYTPRIWRPVVVDLAYLIPRLLLPASAILFTLRLTGPRPPLGELLRQFGFWASATAIASLVFLSVAGVAARIEIPLWSTPAAVASAWLLWILIGQRPEKSDWIDRLGVTVGVCWIAAGPLLFYAARCPA